jgi:hypothetical protein
MHLKKRLSQKAIHTLKKTPAAAVPCEGKVESVDFCLRSVGFPLLGAHQKARGRRPVRGHLLIKNAVLMVDARGVLWICGGASSAVADAQGLNLISHNFCNVCRLLLWSHRRPASGKLVELKFHRALSGIHSFNASDAHLGLSTGAAFEEADEDTRAKGRPTV